MRAETTHSEVVRWRGVGAPYTRRELAEMHALRAAGADRRELWFLHMLRASFGAERRYDLDVKVTS